MATEKVYWKGFDQLANTEVSQRMAQNEFATEIPVEQFLGDDKLMGNAQTSRRDFLKYLGFGRPTPRDGTHPVCGLST